MFERGCSRSVTLDWPFLFVQVWYFSKRCHFKIKLIDGQNGGFPIFFGRWADRYGTNQLTLHVLVLWRNTGFYLNVDLNRMWCIQCLNVRESLPVASRCGCGGCVFSVSHWSVSVMSLSIRKMWRRMRTWPLAHGCVCSGHARPPVSLQTTPSFLACDTNASALNLPMRC